jgi:hypothetical protein
VQTNASDRLAILGWIVSGTQETGVVGGNGTAQYPTGSGTSQTGFLGNNCSGSRVTLFYKDGESLGSQSTPSGSFPITNYFCHALNNNGAPATYSYRRIGPTVISAGYSAVEIRTLYQTINQYEQEMAQTP